MSMSNRQTNNYSAPTHEEKKTIPSKEDYELCIASDLIQNLGEELRFVHTSFGNLHCKSEQQCLWFMIR